MPRPTVAQLVYGSCTVILSTVAMLALSQTSSGIGVAVIALAALALGLLVAMTVPLPGTRPTGSATAGQAPAEPARLAERRRPVGASAETVRGRAAS
ncbi:hypothetical protein [Streptomyces sp. NBC_01601]|uniref:hypothetical protein n=1 Tax=Streptomyces sp. NBC_01601 TaxID=2975892 RepID=UPI002E2A7791|nr:hypothetical protein [Streptomyces sp. NBC_01601]